MRHLLVAFTMMAAISVQAAAIEITKLPALQQAVSNNAVTLVATEKGVYLYSFLGLGSGKSWQDVSAAAQVLNPGDSHWTELEPVPGGGGRLAASAVTVSGAAWVFGGYTVAADGSEKSIPGVYRIRPGESRLEWVTDMPVPVEDSVILVYKDRFVYLISGWHDLGNVNLVQVLDTQAMNWTQATPWPGAPVFGHAGGIAADNMLLCDGVRIQYPADDSPREFVPSNQCWAGRIDAENQRRIHWRSIPPHPGEGRYRMAASGDAVDRVVFAGGSMNPYNFSGIGYNGVPSKPESSVFSFSFSKNKWRQHGDLPQATMDHRGLPYTNGWYYLIGGMHENQSSVTDVYRFRLEAE